jgi:hypothetical protein
MLLSQRVATVCRTTTVGFLDRYLSKRLDALDPLRKSVNGDVGFDLRVVEK